MSWIYLALAILFEVAGTTNMKLSKGFTFVLPSVLIFVFYAISFVMLTFALREIDISIAYAIWAGVGTALIVAIGIFWFKEPATTAKIVSIFLIIAGVIALNFSGPIDK